jgi:tripartite-type tricarboxylate transporter receptor subunit TctC
MKLPRLPAGTTAIVAMMVLGAGTAAGQSYPVKPVRIVTAPAGAGNDFVARMIALGIAGGLGQQLVVDNRPASLVGEIVAKSPPDGYTLLAIGSVLWLTPFLQDHVAYDPVKDFAPVSFTARSVNLLVVHPSIPATSVKQLVALAKARPGQLNYATGATGASNHLAAELFKSMARVELVRIPYKGSGPAMNDLVSGQVQLMFPTTAAGMPHVKSGRLRALGVTSLQPSPLAPGLPTVAASGLPGYESVVIYALLAPARTPETVINRLHGELVQLRQSGAAAEKFAGVGVEVVAGSPADLAAVMKSEMTRVGKLIKDAGIRAQ